MRAIDSDVVNAMKCFLSLLLTKNTTRSDVFSKFRTLSVILSTLISLTEVISSDLQVQSYQNNNFKYGIEGESLLGLCHQRFPCKKAQAILSKEGPLVFGWLDGTFNNSATNEDKCPCGSELLGDKRSKIVRVHIINGPGLRNRRLQRHELGYGFTISTLDREILKYPSANQDSQFLQNFRLRLRAVADQIKTAGGSITCYISPCLECDLTDESRKKLLEIAAEEIPACQLVDNPLKKSCLPGYICETHQVKKSKPAPCIADMDGVDQRDVDLAVWRELHKHCLLMFKWQDWYNLLNLNKESGMESKGIEAKRSNWVPPLQR